MPINCHGNQICLSDREMPNKRYSPSQEWTCIHLALSEKCSGMVFLPDIQGSSTYLYAPSTKRRIAIAYNSNVQNTLARGYRRFSRANSARRNTYGLLWRKKYRQYVYVEWKSHPILQRRVRSEVPRLAALHETVNESQTLIVIMLYMAGNFTYVHVACPSDLVGNIFVLYWRTY